MVEPSQNNNQEVSHLESGDSVEEFSSFDISDQGSIGSQPNMEHDHFYKSDEDYPGIDSISTPKKKSALLSSKSSEMGTTSTKPPSRLSSDTFDTPKTVETRASTMTSNTIFYHKPISNQLKFSDATVEINKLTNIHSKRLSRCTDFDSSLDKSGEMDSLRNPASLNELFSTLSLGESNTPYIDDVSELQKQVTNYKVQIKLLQGLMREKFMDNKVNNEDSSEDFEQYLHQKEKVSNDNRSQILNEKVENNTKKSCEYEDYEEMVHLYETLKEKNSEFINNQHEWHNIVLNALHQLEVIPNKNETFNDILHTFLTHVEDLKKKYEKLKNDFENTSPLKPRIQELTTLLRQYELSSQKMEDKISVLNRTLDIEKAKVKELEFENADLISDLKYFRDRELKHDGIIKRLKGLEQINIQLKNENNLLRQEAISESKKTASLIKMMSSYHSVMLNLLTSVIDPKSCGDIIKVCETISFDSPLNELSKVFTVAHNYEIESLSTILQSYENLMKDKKSYKLGQQQILDLRSQINTLNEKIHNLEEINEKETTRVQELEKQNAHFQKLSSRFNNESEKLEKLRLEDLNNKWKAAEEALSQYKKGAKKKVAELEEEIQNLRNQTN